MGGLDESYEDGDGLDELEEQLDESIVDCRGLGESGRRTPTSFG